jgi:hypothetical protein
VTAFLHLAPTGCFDRGVFVPYETAAEAECQAAWELLHGADPDLYLGVFAAEYRVGPRRGWVYSEGGAVIPEQAEIAASPHLDPEQRTKIHTKAALVKAAKKLVPAMYEEEHRAIEEHLLAQAEQIRRGLGDFQAAIPGNAYTWCTGGTATATPAALSAATAKTVILIVAAAANQPSITEVSISFDGVTAANVPVLVELISGTAGGAGTPRAALAAGKQVRGWPAQTSQTTAADTYSAEPTTELVNKKWLVSPNGGLLVVQNPLGREPTGIVTSATDAKTWGIRATAPATVNCHSYIEFEE